MDEMYMGPSPGVGAGVGGGSGQSQIAPGQMNPNYQPQFAVQPAYMQTQYDGYAPQGHGGITYGVQGQVTQTKYKKKVKSANRRGAKRRLMNSAERSDG